MSEPEFEQSSIHASVLKHNQRSYFASVALSVVLQAIVEK